jgi:PTS system sucrose-specific IIC component
MDNLELAKRIIDGVGGKDNIQSIAHCATRLRIMTADKDKIDVDSIENLDKVKGTMFNAGQYQVILGTGLVDKIYDETTKILGQTVNSNTEPVKKEGSGFQRAVRVFGDVFVPIIPVLVATGLFMGLRGVLTQDSVLGIFGLTPNSIPSNLLLFTKILTDTAFAFLPALVCWSTFKIFGGNPVLGIVLGLMLVNPALPNAYAVGSGDVKPLVFFGFINVVGYQGSVLPAFITGIVGAKFEKFLKTKIPDSLDLILTPFLTLVVGITLALFAIGPVFHEVELIVLTVVKFLLAMPFGLGGLLYGSFGQLLGTFGVHHILNFLEISMLSQTGWNWLNPIGTCGNMGQAGAVLAIAIKTTSPKMKQIAFPSALSATLGITEPAVFGVNLRLMRPFIMAMIGGGVGGFLASILKLKATGMALTGIPGTLLYLNDQLPFYILVNLVAFAVAFVLTYLFGYQNKVEAIATVPTDSTLIENSAVATVDESDTGIYMPIDGKVLPISEVDDPMFSSKALGDGIAFVPSSDTLYSPINGKVMAIFPTKHAISLQMTDGKELLLHIGIDTVELNGEGFEVLVKDGAPVNQQTPLVRINFDILQQHGKDNTIMLVFPDQKGLEIPEVDSKPYKQGDLLFDFPE